MTEHAEPTIRLRQGAASWREIEGETVLLDLENSVYLGLNAAGTTLWPALAEGATRADLVDRLTAAFGIDRTVAEADVDAFVESVRERGLLEG